MVSTLSVNVTETKKQQRINKLYSDYEQKSPDIIVVNTCPKIHHKTLKDYTAKLFRPFNELLLFIRPPQTKARFFYNNLQHKSYVDTLIKDINRLKKESKDSKIYLKGLEYFDDELRKYLLQHTDCEQNNLNAPVNLHFFTLETSDGSHLDSLEYIPQEECKKNIQERKFIVTCMPRNRNYLEYLKDFHYSAHHIHCSVIGFNYRGADLSEGMVWTEQNMILDTISQVERLIALGAKAEHIGLEGACIGGNIATIAAAHLHKQGHKVHLYTERSCRSLTRFLLGYLWPQKEDKFWQPKTWLKCVAILIICLIVAPAQWFSGWRLNAAEAWNKIPTSNKTYSVVRSFAHETPKINDGVIEDSFASMASLLDEQRQKIQFKIKTGKILTTSEIETFNDKPESHYFNKVVTPEKTRRKPHHLPRRFLWQHLEDKHQTMHDYAIHFFEEAFQKKPCN